MFLKEKVQSVLEEGVRIFEYDKKISKKLKVFYNPEMKINRDTSILILKNYFKEKPIHYCDPMAASGIRQIRFLKTIPKIFSKLTLGDISKSAIKDMKRNFKKNKIKTNKIKFENSNALKTLLNDYYDSIEVDPFGTPVPFLDIAIQRIKHKGLLCITATDTATLCGTYPKTCKRRYGIKVEKTLFHEELGLRNLIAYCQREGAKYEKNLTPLVSFSNKHFFRVFLEVEDGRKSALETINNLKYIKWNKKSQEIKISEFETKDTFGKTYIGKLNNKEFLKEIQKDINLIEKNKEVSKLIQKLIDELDIFGYVNPHKLEKEYKFSSKIKYEILFEELEKKKFKISRVHNDKYGIKTNAKTSSIIKIMKKYI